MLNDADGRRAEEYAGEPPTGTPGKRIRLWARQASGGQVAMTAMVAVALLGMLVAVTIPHNSGDESPVRVGGLEQSTLAPAPGAPEPLGGPSSPGAVFDLPSSGSLAEPTSSPGSGATAGVPTSAGPDEATEGGTEDARAASDQGVTAETIKIGFTLNRPAGLSATGFAFGLRQDDEKAIKAMVDYVNAAGGVKGRRVTYVTVDVDPTNRATWQSACVRLTQDERVFAVLNPGAYLGTGHACYIEQRVPQATSGSVSMPASMIRDAQGYMASTYASATRVLLNWATTMLDIGVIGPGKGKVGLLTDDCPEYVEPWKQLKSVLNDAGVQFTQVSVSCDIGAAQQQVPSAVLQMRRADVDRVFLGAIFSTDQTFMQQAAAQGWRPKYSVSDLWANNVDPLAKNFPPDQFDGALGSAANHSGEEAADIAYSPGVQKCNEMITKAGLPPITEQMGKDAIVVSNCDNFLLWLAVMEKVPVNFTRAQWAAAVPQVGAMKMPAVGASATFGPGKFEGGDSYAVVEWRKSCTCWVQVRPHQPGKF